MPSSAPRGKPAALVALIALLGSALAGQLIDDTKADEGVKHVAYPDLGGVFTICSGTTTGVKAGDTADDEECDAKTASDLLKAARIVLRASPGLKAHHNQLRAVTRFQNNTGKYPVSSARLAFNAGRLRDGCDRLLAYNGIISTRPIRGAVEVRRMKDGRYFSVIRGLKNRRANEHKICVLGL